MKAKDALARIRLGQAKDLAFRRAGVCPDAHCDCYADGGYAHETNAVSDAMLASVKPGASEGGAIESGGWRKVIAFADGSAMLAWRREKNGRWGAFGYKAFAPRRRRADRRRELVNERRE